MSRHSELNSVEEQSSGSHLSGFAAPETTPDPLPLHQQLSLSASTSGDFQNLSADFVAPSQPGADFSLDPYAGHATFNGLPIYTPQEAADNLNRAGVNFTFGNNGALDDGVLTYGFWSSLDEVQHSYYTETNADGEVLTQDGDYISQGVFAPFTAEQQAMAIQNIGLWDDLIAVTFKQADSAADADITFGFTQMSPAAGAHTYYPQEEALNDYYGFVNAGKAAGDVWANIAYQGDFSGSNGLAGGYGWFAITHELGHSLGLSHGGEYNASDDNDGDGQPDPITYDNDAYFAQDTQQYTIMSYFDGSYTGQAAVNWNTGYFAYAQTPAVHDILAVQEVYGADYTTRAGDTVYGFHSTADRDIFDFTQNTTPILTIWDGGGNDTLDLSGFSSNAIIDINEGAFSSAGQEMSAEYLAYFASLGIDTQYELDAFYARNGLGPDGRPVDNIAIAYGAQIENAVGGSGDDILVSNSLANVLNGNGGSDTVSYTTATAAVGVNLASHSATGGGGSDTLMSIENAVGSAFNDTLLGDGNANTFEGGRGNDTLNGAAGLDTASYASASAAVTVNLGTSGAQNTGGAGRDTLISIENLTGSRFNDHLIGNADANVIKGGNGVDVVTLGGGNDVFVAELGSGAATKTGASSWDVITDFDALGNDRIDLSDLGMTFTFDGTRANKDAGDLTYKVYDSITGAENALGIDIHDQPGASGIGGPVTVVYANLDGGSPDLAMILLNHSSVTANDFIFA